MGWIECSHKNSSWYIPFSKRRHYITSIDMKISTYFRQNDFHSRVWFLRSLNTIENTKTPIRASLMHVLHHKHPEIWSEQAENRSVRSYGYRNTIRRGGGGLRDEGEEREREGRSRENEDSSGELFFFFCKIFLKVEKETKDGKE